MPAQDEPRLTSLSHGGGCGCKIAPDVLATLMQNLLPADEHPELLVGADSNDDAAVYRLDEFQALVATTDFFMPIVDDPHDFGRIAATNALSDIYAMGARPLLALALLGMPVNRLGTDTIRAILDGGASVCRQAGIPLAGGHSIDSVEPIYGLAVIGLVPIRNIKRNNSAQAEDRLIISKPLGVGILSAALKKNRLVDSSYQAMIASTTQLNAIGSQLAAMEDVHAMTDITGFGLLGHTLEMCKGSALSAELDFARLPWLADAAGLASQGVHTGASARNWNACNRAVDLSNTLPEHAQTLLCDPQTSGGLLIACSAPASSRVLELLHAAGFAQACEIGRMKAGPARVHVQ